MPEDRFENANGASPKMKTLLLLRHAKSQWPDGVGPDLEARARALETLDDHARPLTPGGVEAAEKLARQVLREITPPDLILCSSATRARQTLATIRQLTWQKIPVETERGLYLCGMEALLARLAKLPDSAAAAALVAHNPDLHALAQRLAVEGKKKWRQSLAEKFPTGALAVIDLPIESWSAVRQAAGQLELLVFPKELPEKKSGR
jgi:phosphohistidine phosphatase